MSTETQRMMLTGSLKDRDDLTCHVIEQLIRTAPSAPVKLSFTAMPYSTSLSNNERREFHVIIPDGGTYTNSCIEVQEISTGVHFQVKLSNPCFFEYPETKE